MQVHEESELRINQKNLTLRRSPRFKSMRQCVPATSFCDYLASFNPDSPSVLSKALAPQSSNQRQMASLLPNFTFKSHITCPLTVLVTHHPMNVSHPKPVNLRPNETARWQNCVTSVSQTPLPAPPIDYGTEISPLN